MNSLTDVTVLLAAAVIAVPVCKRLRLGSVLGYLIAGLAIGPHGLALISNVESIAHTSELGVVMLLFIIGLELQPSRLWILRKSVFGLGGAQVLISTMVLGLLAMPVLRLDPVAALAVGFALSLSSTAFVLQVLGERQELTHHYGRSSFAILLFQDLAVIPFLAVLPFLTASSSMRPSMEMAMAIGKAVGALAVVGLVGAFLVRPMFRFIAASKNHEVFTAAALLVVISTALFVESAGLSMSLGAFLAGVLLANSEYRHELQANIEPFEGLLLGLFFLSVGMSADITLVADRPVAITVATIGLMLIKSGVLAGIGVASRQPREATLRLALALPQGGEFAFVLFALAAKNNMLDASTVDFLVVVVSLSMALTPLAFFIADKVGMRMRKPPAAFDTIVDADKPVIIAGFGRVGQIVGRILRTRKVGFTALEISQSQVDFLRRFGNRIYYGDASRLELLRAAGAEQAEIFVLAIDDIEASVRTAEIVKRHFPHLKILARARNREHVYRLMDLGVDFLMRETFGSSLELGEAVLKSLGCSVGDSQVTIERFKEHDQRMLIAAQTVYKDEAKLIETARNFAKELESLFESDTPQGQSLEPLEMVPRADT